MSRRPSRFSHATRRLAAPYVSSVTEPLINTLEFQSGVQPPGLAGYAANIDFWMSEVRHRLSLIDDYPKRFQRFVRAGGRHHGRSFAIDSPPIPNLSEGTRAALRRRLLQATERWIAHLTRHGLLEITTADDLRKEFDIPYGRT